MTPSRDKRIQSAGMVLAATVVIGFLLRGEITEYTARVENMNVTSQGEKSTISFDERFQNAVALLHTGHYEPAVRLFNKIVIQAPWMPEAEVNLAYALMGMELYEEAELHFERALVLNEQQLNAYYGLAISRERQGDLDTALGAMRVYAHLAKEDDPYLRKAWSAIWEWETARRAGEKVSE